MLVSRLFENVPMWTRLKCPHLGVAAVAAMPVDGDFVNEREGKEAFRKDSAEATPQAAAASGLSPFLNIVV
jgi:hypothetical protein